jgi:hypothetical protein
VDKLVQKFNSEPLLKFYKLHLNINETLNETLLEIQKTAGLQNPYLLLAPTLAKKANVAPFIFEKLKNIDHSSKKYYEPCGIYLLFADCDLFSDIDFKQFKSLDPLKAFEIEVQRCLKTSIKDFAGVLKSYSELLNKNTEYQNVLATLLSQELEVALKTKDDSNLPRLEKLLALEKKIIGHLI